MDLYYKQVKTMSAVAYESFGTMLTKVARVLSTSSFLNFSL